jgi:endo-1,4-beta-D-glucanase Y
VVATAVTDSMLQSEYAAWKASLVQECPSDNSAVVVKDGGQVVSEGIAYGMLISVNMDDQALFDKLWKFYTDHLDENGLMNWSMGVCDAPGNNMAHAAADAELDALMALLQANAAWGGTYVSDAQTLAGNILLHEVEECDGRTILKPGDVWGGCSDMTGQERINPSYFAPGYYRAFAKAFPDQAATWTALLEGSYELIPPIQTRLGGLFPDWSGVDGSDWYDAGYGYDACRTPWRLATDYAWTAEPRALTALEGVASWVQQNGGIPATNMPNNSAFNGTFALASIGDAANFDTQVGAWLNSGGDDGPYFQATLRMLYLLVAGGRFPSTL